jgi:hypothetical protein
MVGSGLWGRRAALFSLFATVLAAAWPAPAQTVQWRPGLTAAQLNSAHVIHMPAGVRLADLKALRDDQVLETPSGRQIQVGRFRQLQQAFETARLRRAQPRPQNFTILAPTPRVAPVALRPNESVTEILARPPDQVVRLPDGHTATVAQLRAIAPYVQQRERARVGSATGRRQPPVGQAMRITSLAQLKSLPPGLPDSTILETSSGTRVTLGEVRQILKARPLPRRTITQSRPAR